MFETIIGGFACIGLMFALSAGLCLAVTAKALKK
jgi:hypothetical protein